MGWGGGAQLCSRNWRGSGASYPSDPWPLEQTGAILTKPTGLWVIALGQRSLFLTLQHRLGRLGTRLPGGEASTPT